MSVYFTDNEDGWVGPDSIAEKAAAERTSVLEGRNVACVTTDYAMQNVMKQLGLCLLSVDGRAIKKVKTFVAKCDGCSLYVQTMRPQQ